MVEVLIGVLTVAAVCLLALGHRVGNVFGLLASPLWLWTTASAGDWGKFAASVVCLACYGAGAWRHRKRRSTMDADERRCARREPE